jgi:hypothetical protein
LRRKREERRNESFFRCCFHVFPSLPLCQSQKKKRETKKERRNSGKLKEEALGFASFFLFFLNEEEKEQEQEGSFNNAFSLPSLSLSLRFPLPHPSGLYRALSSLFST